MNPLSPEILVKHISLIGQIISVMILVIFDDFFTQNITFKGVDRLKEIIFTKSKEKITRKYQRKIIKYFFEFLATIIFLAYFFAGYWILSEYIVIPILERQKNIILILILIFFFTMSWMLNNRKVRKKYLGYK